jgi:hypothetical protein
MKLHVVPRHRGWAVIEQDTSWTLAFTDTQGQAAYIARQRVINAGGGEVILHDKDGTVKSSHTYGNTLRRIEI